MKNITLISNLTDTAEFKKLQELGLLIHDAQHQFDLLSVYKDLIDEMAWSRLFAYLLDSTQNHGLGQSAFRKLIQLIPDLNLFLKSIPTDVTTQTICETEWSTEKSRRVDILLKLIDQRGTIEAVIGIENKVDSGEQKDQIRDYQKSLSKAFPKIPKVLIYLTPDGRASETADNNLNCPALFVSYATISTVCEEIKPQTTSQGQIFLSVLKHHIDKLTNNQMMDKEVIQLIQSLYKDPSHRHAIKLISQYSPNIRSVFDEILIKLSKLKTLPFTIDKTAIEYYPKTTSSPHEFKLYPDELSDIMHEKGFNPSYILRCENANPDFGHFFTLRVALWNSNIKVRDAAERSSLREKVTRNFAFPNTLGPNKHWSQWICIWTGNSYKLSDLGEKDVEGLSQLLINGIKQTYDQYRLGLMKLAKSQI